MNPISKYTCPSEQELLSAFMREIKMNRTDLVNIWLELKDIANFFAYASFYDKNDIKNCFENSIGLNSNIINAIFNTAVNHTQQQMQPQKIDTPIKYLPLPIDSDRYI